MLTFFTNTEEIMRYDFGNVYKEIRESKGLTQEDVCGSVLSRTSLSKIESGKTTPKYENMEFLLRQVNMSFEEFEYICQLYQPSQRTEIMQTYLNMSSILGTSELEKLFQKCQACSIKKSRPSALSPPVAFTVWTVMQRTHPCSTKLKVCG